MLRSCLNTPRNGTSDSAIFERQQACNRTATGCSHTVLDSSRVQSALQNHPSRTLHGCRNTKVRLLSDRHTRATLVQTSSLLCAASSSASARGRPIITPPSAIASSTSNANAGPEPDKAVHASKCFSSRKRHRPIGLKRDPKILRSRAGWDDFGAGGVTTVKIGRAHV